MSKDYRESNPSEIVDISFFLIEKPPAVKNDVKLFTIKTKDYPKIGMKIETYEYEIKD